MPQEALTALVIAGAAGVASLAGGALGLVHRPSTLLMSIAFGFAGGTLLGTVAFEMLPKAIELASVPLAVGGFGAGFLAIYAFDLVVHRGVIAGEHAEQRRRAALAQRRLQQYGGEGVVLAGGTSLEEVVEGVTIGIGVALQPSLAVLIGLSIAIDNLAEGLSIAEMFRGTAQRKRPWRRTFLWTGLIGAALTVSAVVGATLLRGLPEPWVGALFAVGGGGIIYLAVTDLIPEGQEHQFQQSAALATGAGMVLVLLISELLLKG